MKPLRGGAPEIPYRADIDGLRATAVLSVIGFHANQSLIPGGFVGVDIFFVISGFLISSLILNRLKDDTFSFLEFYGRRIRRLFPALTIVLLTTLILGWFTLFPAEYAALGKNTLAGAAFVANIQTYSEIGYFDAPAATKPLLHLWSLGVEEQFYFIFPALLLLANRYRTVTPSFALLGILSFGLNIALVRSYPAFTFYLPLTRFWEFVAGGLLALCTSSDRPAGPSSVAALVKSRRDIIAVAGTTLIIAGISFTRAESFPGWLALLPVIGTVFLIGAGPQAWINRTILANPGLGFIGLISYPLYLWHWPLLVIGRTVMGVYNNEHVRTTTIVAVLLTFVLSWLTYRFIEVPIRTRKSAITARAIIAGCSFSLVAVAFLGFAVLLGNGLPSRYPKELQVLIPPLNVGYVAVDETKKSDGPLLVTYGDSHADQLLPGLSSLQTERTFRLLSINWGRCAPLIHRSVPAEKDSCRQLTIDNEKLEHLKPDIVIVGALWPTYTHIDKLSELLRFFQRIGAHRIVVVGQVPIWPRPLQQMLYRAYRADPLHKIPDRLPSRDMEPSIDVMRRIDQQLKEIASDAGATFVSARDVFCNENGCLALLGSGAAKDIVQLDMHHLSPAGSRFLVRHIANQIFE
jgi:peptidoglycan/LPS O-acetylase OafA/YrhL